MTHYSYAGEEDWPDALRSMVNTYRRRREGNILDFFAEVREHIYIEGTTVPMQVDASYAPPMSKFFFGRWWEHPVVAEAAVEVCNLIVQEEIRRHGRDAAALAASGKAAEIAARVTEHDAFLAALQRREKARITRKIAENDRVA